MLKPLSGVVDIGIFRSIYTFITLNYTLMPSGLSFGLNLVSLVVFLLPGLAGVKIGLLIADRADWLNRVDTIALSFGVSLVAMGSVYIWHSALAHELLTIDAVSPVWNTIPLGIITYWVCLSWSGFFSVSSILVESTWQDEVVSGIHFSPKSNRNLIPKSIKFGFGCSPAMNFGGGSKTTVK